MSNLKLNNTKISLFRNITNDEKEILQEFGKKDYPYLPLKDFRIKSTDYKLTDEQRNELLDFNLDSNSLHLNTTFDVFKTIIFFSKKENSTNLNDDSFTEVINFIKEYFFQRMDEIMELARTNHYDVDSISECRYLSIDIINKWNNFKFNWELVSSNKSITDRDILANPDLPWDCKIFLEKRFLPRNFYIYKQFPIPNDYDECVNDEKMEYSKLEILISPKEPIDFTDFSKIKDEDIETSLELLKTEFPEYFINPSDKFMKDVRNEIIKCIFKCGFFILDDFQFPDDLKENHHSENFLKKPHVEECEATEDDPYCLRNIIEFLKINTSKIDNIRLWNKYWNKTGLSSINTGNIFIKNRQEYLDLIKSLKGRSGYYELEKCIFFEIEDVFNYPDAFYLGKTHTLLKSGKIDIAYVETHIELNWNFNDLVEYLPIHYCVKNLLHYPDRLRTPFLNITRDSNDINKIYQQLILEDAELFSIFSRRPDVCQNLEPVFQYPFLKWKFENSISYNFPYQIRNLFKNNDRYEKKYESRHRKKDQDISLLPWDFIKTEKGMIYFDHDFNNSDLEKTIKKNYTLKINLSDHIPNEIIINNKNSKWYAPSYVNLDRLIKSYKEKCNGDLVKLYIFILFVCSSDLFQSFADSNPISNITDIIVEIIDNKLINSNNRSSVYDLFISSFYIQRIFMSKFINRYRIIERDDNFELLNQKFTIDDISMSKYNNYDYCKKIISDEMTKIFLDKL